MAHCKTFGDLKIGTVVNFFRPTTADDTDFVVLKQTESRFGSFTQMLNKKNNNIEPRSQHTEIKGFWKIVKEPNIEL